MNQIRGMHDTNTRSSQGEGFTADQGNPYDGYRGQFTDFFDFGPAYRRWVEDCMLSTLGIHSDDERSYRLADIGAGTCFWAQRLLRRAPTLHIVAVEPSAALLDEQCVPMTGSNFDVSKRIQRERITAQQFAHNCADPASLYHQSLDGAYFMQSAHYIHSSEFPQTMQYLAKAIKPGGRLVFQARNMNATWWPWPFPNEWHESIVAALEPLYSLADRYEAQLREMDLFSTVSQQSWAHEISVPSESYWSRLRARWIPSLMDGSKISDNRLDEGIRAMRERYECAGKDTVKWEDVLTYVSATIKS